MNWREMAGSVASAATGTRSGDDLRPIESQSCAM
jgi:hypothetical protein